jgi:hypothetical protein
MWLVAVVVLASACGRSAGEQPPAMGEPCAAPFARGEFGSNFAMVSSLSNVPSIGETATLTVGVCAKESARATVSVHLFDGIEWRTPPASTTVTTQAWVYGGCEDIATGAWDLPAMTPMTLVGTVVASKTGTALLEASVTAADDSPPAPGNSTSIAITVGTDDSSSYFGLPENFNESSSSAGPPQEPVCD